MTTSTSFERRRRFARRARLFISTILCPGLALCSPAMAQSGSDLSAPPKTFTMTPTGVNLLDLSFTHEVNDLSVGPLTLTRSYVSGRVLSNKYFGDNWTHNFDVWARQYTAHEFSYTNRQNITEVVIGRTTHRFYGFASNAYPENDEIGTKLADQSGAIVFTDRDGTVYQFSGTFAAQKISTITSPDGSILSFSYISGNLKTVVSNRGYAIVFDYAGNTISAACGYNLSQTAVSTATTCNSSPLRTSYGHAAGSLGGTLLTSATSVNGDTTQYSYASMNNGDYLSCITDPSASTCKITNTWKWRNDLPLTVVSQQTLADGSTWKFDCSCGFNAKAAGDDPNPDPEWTSVTEPNNAQTYTEFTQGSMSSHTDENNRNYQFSYSGRYPLEMTRPEGDKVLWHYKTDSMTESGRTLKAKPGFGLPDLNVEAKTFPTSCTPATCNKPLTITDANGNEIDFGYTDYGAVAWELQPPSISGAARPLKLHSYVSKSAYDGTSVWMPDTETACQTRAGFAAGYPGAPPTCDGRAPIVATSYEYAADGTPDSLLPRSKVVSADGQSLRSCYRYDAVGNKLTETSPRAGLASCPA